MAFYYPSPPDHMRIASGMEGKALALFSAYQHGLSLGVP
jgi:hypothetical protein